MTNQLSKQQRCLYVRVGIQVWIDEDKSQKIQADLSGKESKGMVMVEGRLINLADVVGIFTPQDIEDLTRRKNGQWKCEKGVWHDRGEKCECLSADQIANRERLKKEYLKKYGEGFMPSM